jgi:hypothetical protein
MERIIVIANEAKQRSPPAAALSSTRVARFAVRFANRSRALGQKGNPVIRHSFGLFSR